MHDIRRSARLPPFDLKEMPDLDARATATLQTLDAGQGTLRHCDHVLIDEAQDFPTAALQVGLLTLNPNSDSLLVVADAAQNIYRNKFTWKAAGIQAAGRTRVLDRSYRNTREILEYAHSFLLRGGDLQEDAEAPRKTRR